MPGDLNGSKDLTALSTLARVKASCATVIAPFLDPETHDWISYGSETAILVSFERVFWSLATNGVFSISAAIF